MFCMSHKISHMLTKCTTSMLSAIPNQPNQMGRTSQHMWIVSRHTITTRRFRSSIATTSWTGQTGNPRESTPCRHQPYCTRCVKHDAWRSHPETSYTDRLPKPGRTAWKGKRSHPTFLQFFNRTCNPTHGWHRSVHTNFHFCDLFSLDA